jgi:hypothetical protein
VVSRGSEDNGTTPPEYGGATEPITLTDPDGAVTRVAPWSSWIREQVRAPGGEPALITRLDQGQLWFSAGRRRSPWRHEVHVGPAVISTPRGRFHAIAEPDGGATVSCLAGRTRVVSGLWAPVLLSPDQTAAISSDGRTLVVMDQTNESVIEVEPVVIDLTAAEEPSGLDDESRPSDQPAAESPLVDSELAVVGASRGRNAIPGSEPMTGGPGLPAQRATGHASGAAARGIEPSEDRRPARLGWIPELVAVAALLALLVAAVWVFTTEAEATDTTSPPPTTTERSSTTERSTTTTERATTTAAPTTSAGPTTTAARRPAAASTAIGTLEACARRGSVVEATVVVEHRSGPASGFEVTAALVDGDGPASATGQATTEVIQPGGSATVTVPIGSTGALAGACELVRVRSV